MSTVLVVDDDESIREVIRLLLEDEGYTVQEASNGLEALDLLSNRIQPTVVLLDYLMPQLDGLGVLLAIRANPDLHDGNVFIMLTANFTALPAPLLDYMKAEHIAILTKPFDTNALLAIVRQAMQQTATASRP